MICLRFMRKRGILCDEAEAIQVAGQSGKHIEARII